MLINQDNARQFIDAKEIILGSNIWIGANTIIKGPNGPCQKVIIGDNVFIDSDIFIMTPQFVIGDYSTIYKNCRISGYKPCTIGHNFWCDQNTILNCTEQLTIGDNVGIGAYSQLWTHIKFGDVLEGCRFNATKPMLIQDDVWFVGHCIVSPITAKSKSMAMVGSVITKDMEENHVYGGCPAVDITNKVGQQFKPRKLDEKYMIMDKILDEFNDLNPGAREFIHITTEFSDLEKNSLSVFNVSNRKYKKTGSSIEIKFMKYLLPLHKFTPYDG